MSYSLDIYRTADATRPIISSNFALFVSFFPQLVAGPIERAATLLPQVRTASTVSNGSRSPRVLFLIAFGLFKKVAIADGVAGSVDSVFHSVTHAQLGRCRRARASCLPFRSTGISPGIPTCAPGNRQVAGLRPDAQFPRALLRRSPREYLAAVAYQPVDLDARLRVLSDWGAVAAAQLARVPQHDGRPWCSAACGTEPPGRLCLWGVLHGRDPVPSASDRAGPTCPGVVSSRSPPPCLAVVRWHPVASSA